MPDCHKHRINLQIYAISLLLTYRLPTSKVWLFSRPNPLNKVGTYFATTRQTEREKGRGKIIFGVKM